MILQVYTPIIIWRSVIGSLKVEDCQLDPNGIIFHQHGIHGTGLFIPLHVPWTYIKINHSCRSINYAVIYHTSGDMGIILHQHVFPCKNFGASISPRRFCYQPFRSKSSWRWCLKTRWWFRNPASTTWSIIPGLGDTWLITIVIVVVP